MDRFGVRPEQIPCTNAVRDPMDGGRFAAVRGMALRPADRAGLARRRRAGA